MNVLKNLCNEECNKECVIIKVRKVEFAKMLFKYC